MVNFKKIILFILFFLSSNLRAESFLDDMMNISLGYGVSYVHHRMQNPDINTNALQPINFFVYYPASYRHGYSTHFGYQYLTHSMKYDSDNFSFGRYYIDFGYNKKIAISRDFSFWVDAGLGLSSTAIKDRYQVDKDGFLVGSPQKKESVEGFYFQAKIYKDLDIMESVDLQVSAKGIYDIESRFSSLEFGVFLKI